MIKLARPALLASLIACTPSRVDPPPSAPTAVVANPEIAEPMAPAIAATPKAEVLDAIKSAWLGLATSEESCGDFDYFPGGGMKSFACHLGLGRSVDGLARASATTIFTKGPHTTDRLDLSNARSFGHYDPKFIRWAIDNLIPAAADPAFRKATQTTYDVNVRPLASAFRVTYEKFEQNPDCLRKEVARYEGLLAGRGVPEMDYERYFFFMNEYFCDNPDGGFDFFSDRGFDGGFSGNVVKTCAAFWIRRTIDGTAEDFYEGLAKLMAIYEPHAPR